MHYKSTWHFLHIVMTLLTAGYWIPVWIICGILNASHNRRVEMEQAEETLALLRRQVALDERSKRP
jgi:hypothetical protein